MDDNTPAGVRNNSTRTTRNTKTITNIAAPVSCARKQSKRADRPNAAEVINWRRYYNTDLLCFDKTKLEGKDTIDMTRFTLVGTNQPVTFKGFKQLINTDYDKTQTILKRGMDYMRHKYCMPKEKN